MSDKEIRTVGELMEHDDHESARKMVQWVAAGLIGLGLLFTGYLNFQLYSRAFSADSKIFGIIPAIIIEGSLATFLLGSFVWFAHGTQGRLAKIFGWAMFGIVALNTIVEFNAQLDQTGGMNEFLTIYTFWGVPTIVPLVVGFWKAVIDADPAIQIMRANRKLMQALETAKHNSKLSKLKSAEHAAALESYGDREAEVINSYLRGDKPKLSKADKETVQALIDAINRGDKDALLQAEALIGDPTLVDTGKKGPKAKRGSDSAARKD